MLSEQTQDEILSYLQKIVETQIRVRNCEIEGMAYPLENDLLVFANYNLIDFSDWQYFTEQLSGKQIPQEIYK
jgi:hypothetical protein